MTEDHTLPARRFDGREDVRRSHFAQEDGKWVKKA